MYMDKSNIETVAIYTRVSTDEQAREGFSLEAQLEKLTSYCGLQDPPWKIYKHYQDPGKSGRKIKNRSGYLEMMQDTNHFDAVLVLKMDRIHRNQRNFTHMIEQLMKNGKSFVSMQERFDTSSAMGRFVMFIIQQIAQLESEQIGERVAVAMNQKAKDISTGCVGHRNAHGYKWNHKKQRYDLVNEELEEVRQAFQMYLDGFSYKAIGSKLGRPRTSIRYWLNNTMYVGYERYCEYLRWIQDYDTSFEPVVSIETWNKVQVLAKERCRTHDYDPLLINRQESHKIGIDKRKSIKLLQRAKHNYTWN